MKVCLRSLNDWIRRRWRKGSSRVFCWCSFSCKKTGFEWSVRKALGPRRDNSVTRRQDQNRCVNETCAPVTQSSLRRSIFYVETLFASEIWSWQWHPQVSRSLLVQGTFITLSLIVFSTDLDNTTSFASNNRNNKIQKLFNVCHSKAKTFSRRLKIISRSMFPQSKAMIIKFASKLSPTEF